MSWLYWCSFDLELKGMTSNLWNLIYEGQSLASFHEKNNFAKRNRGTIMINWMLLISNCNSSYGTGEKKKHSISAFQHLQRGILETTFKVVSLDLICFFCPPKQFFVWTSGESLLIKIWKRWYCPECVTHLFQTWGNLHFQHFKSINDFSLQICRQIWQFCCWTCIFQCA